MKKLSIFLGLFLAVSSFAQGTFTVINESGGWLDWGYGQGDNAVWGGIGDGESVVLPLDPLLPYTFGSLDLNLFPTFWGSQFSSGTFHATDLLAGNVIPVPESNPVFFCLLGLILWLLPKMVKSHLALWHQYYSPWPDSGSFSEFQKK